MAFLKQNAYRIGLVIVLLIAGAILAFIYQRSHVLTGTSPFPDSDQGTPDQYLENVSYTRFDDQGRPYQRLESPRVRHFSESGQSLADAPRLQMIDSSNRTWHARGDSGTVENDNNLITLAGNAQVTQPGDEWRMETDTLHYDHAKGHIWSNGLSHLYQGAQTTQGDRFEAWTDNRAARLNGNVQSSFKPNQ